ncbi:MAG: hypothetical protein ABI628_08655 [Chloroflexota bacterium]
MTGQPDLRGRLRATGALQAEVLVGPRVRRWAITAGSLVTVGLTSALATAAGLPFALAMALALVALLVVALWLTLATMPDRDRPIAGAILMAGRRELSRFRRASGQRFPPRTAWGIRRWLGRVPETAANQVVRATYLIDLGRYDAAAEIVDRIEQSGPVERFGRARLAAIVDFERGGLGDLGPTRLAFGAIDDPQERAVAAWQLALEDARQRYVLGGDWRAPLEVAAGSADPRARSIRAWLPTLIWGALPILLALYLLALAVELAVGGSIL